MTVTEFRPNQKEIIVLQQTFVFNQIGYYQMAEHFQKYPYASSFKIRTDHVTLQFLLPLKNLEGQLARWTEQL